MDGGAQRSLPPARSGRGRLVSCWLGLAVALVALLSCAGCLQAALYWWVPPYTRKGWVDDQRLTPPAWRMEIPRVNGYDTYQEMIPDLPSGYVDTTFAWQCAGALTGVESCATESDLPRGEAFVNAHRAALDKLREGADQQYASGKVPSPDTLFPEFAKYRGAARLAASAAWVDHERGRDDQALRHLEDAIALGVNLLNGESSIQGLVGGACITIGQRPAAVVVRSGGPSTAALRRHASRTRELRGRMHGLAGTLAWSAASSDATLDMVARGELSDLWQAVTESDVPIPPEARLSPKHISARMKIESTRAWLHDRYARTIAEADKPPRQSQLVEMSDETDQDLAERGDELAAGLLDYGVWIRRRWDAIRAKLVAEEIIAGFAEDVGYVDGSGAVRPPFAWDEERRLHLRCQLDALYFHLYGLSREDTEYVLGTFPIMRRRDEKAYGRYRTAELVLHYWSAYAVGDMDAWVSA